MRIKESSGWDHKHTLKQLSEDNGECIYNPNYKPHSDSDCTVAVGCILIKHDCDDDGYTEIALSKEGWEYTCDSYNPLGENLIKMKTIDAIDLIERRFENEIQP